MKKKKQKKLERDNVSSKELSLNPSLLPPIPVSPQSESNKSIITRGMVQKINACASKMLLPKTILTLTTELIHSKAEKSPPSEEFRRFTHGTRQTLLQQKLAQIPSSTATLNRIPIQSSEEPHNAHTHTQTTIKNVDVPIHDSHGPDVVQSQEGHWWDCSDLIVVQTSVLVEVNVSNTTLAHSH